MIFIITGLFVISLAPLFLIWEWLIKRPQGYKFKKGTLIIIYFICTLIMIAMIYLIVDTVHQYQSLNIFPR